MKSVVAAGRAPATPASTPAIANGFAGQGPSQRVRIPPGGSSVELSSTMAHSSTEPVAATAKTRRAAASARRPVGKESMTRKSPSSTNTQVMRPRVKTAGWSEACSAVRAKTAVRPRSRGPRPLVGRRAHVSSPTAPKEAISSARTAALTSGTARTSLRSTSSAATTIATSRPPPRPTSTGAVGAGRSLRRAGPPLAGRPPASRSTCALGCSEAARGAPALTGASFASHPRQLPGASTSWHHALWNTTPLRRA